MIQVISFDNAVAWASQVLILASLGALLPLLFRIRHPRTHLAYCHAVLAACLLLPFLQRWRHPVVVTPPATAADLTRAGGPPGGRHGGARRAAWEEIVPPLFLVGAAGRLCWMLAGLWTIRRYRIASTPLYPVPDSVAAARAITGADAAICLSSQPVGPVTFGFFRPVVLLPESFLELDDEAQCGILCHELLHVRRHDWLVTVLEESAAVLCWFHPAVWWLLAQTRLVREELVDAEVVRLMAGSESYVMALLAIAGKRPPLDLVPAPLFLRRRHLTERVHLLLRQTSMSRARLLGSYASIAAVLAVAAWTAFGAFPLVGQPRVTEAVTADGPGVRIDPGGALVYRPPVVYPGLGRRVEGTVLLDLTVGARGQVADARVVSGPQDLRLTALQSVLAWRYAAGTPASVRAAIDFRDPTTAAEAALQEALCRDESADGVLESIDAGALPEPFRSSVWQAVRGFQGQPFSNALMCRIRAAVSAIDTRIGCGWGAVDGKPGRTLSLAMGSGPPGPQPGERLVYRFPPSPTARAFGDMRSKLVRRVDPVYPPEARAAGISGTVRLFALIAPDGRVSQVHVESGPEPLRQAAADAVMQWRYPPVRLAGVPMEIETPVAVQFQP